MSRASRLSSRAIRGVSLPTFTFLVWFVALSGPLSASAEPSIVDGGRLKAARDFERSGAWLEACRAYDDVLRKERNHLAAREGYQRCLRRLHMVVRHADPVYRQMLRTLAPPDALDAYEQVLYAVQSAYPDSSRSNCTHLFQQGLSELRFALEDERFCKNFLPTVKAFVLRELKARLANVPFRRLNTRAEVRDQVLSILRIAPREAISALVMEFAAGACNALDEQSSFVSPGNLALVQAALGGKLVGVGLDIGIDPEDRLVITRVHPKSPAEDAGLLAGDRLVRIADTRVEDMPVEAVAERLRGATGSVVEVEVIRDSDPTKRLVKMIRRPVSIPSVEYDLFRLDDGTTGGIAVGYIKILHFQESTPQDVKDAFEAMAQMGGGIPKGIVLDLRGNPGGVFKAAVAVAELFVSGGVIVIGQSPLKDYNKPFKADGVGPLQMPLVVLIDGDTASAAEVLAGALRDSRPGAATKLLGRTTHGKGSVQCLIPVDGPLERLAGVRLTVAKLFSPTNQPYTGRGVAPHEVSNLKGEDLVTEARRHLLELLRPGMAPMRVMATMENPS